MHQTSHSSVVPALCRRKSKSIICAICVLCGLIPARALEISHTAISNITRISADYSGVVIATNGSGTNPTITIYYGTSDAATNATNWAHSCIISNVDVGEFSTNLAGLTPAQYYYCNILATEGTDSVWAAASTSWWTLAGAPTNDYPAATSGVFMIAGTNGAFLSPSKEAVIAANELATQSNISNLQAQVTNSAAGWSAHPATQDVDIAGFGLILGGETRSNWPAPGTGDVSTWSFHPATQDVDIAGFGINLGGETRSNWPSIASLGALAASSNLLDLADPDAARSNLSAASSSDISNLQAQVTNSASAWSAHPATQDVDIAGFGITLGGETRSNWLDTAWWAYYPAYWDLDMDGNAIYDCGGIELGGVMRTDWPSEDWAAYPAQTNIDLGGHTISNGYFVGDASGLSNIPWTQPTNNINLSGNTISNGYFVGDGGSLTNCPERWSQHPATQTVNMASFGLANVGSISLGGETRTNWPEAAAIESNLTEHLADTNPHSITPELIGALAASSNLLDVADPDAARSNLSAAAQADLSALQTNLTAVQSNLTDHQAATNPHSITPELIGALAASSNLLDVADSAAARSNLGAAAAGDIAGWSGYVSTQLIARIQTTISTSTPSGYITGWTNSWGAGWTDAGAGIHSNAGAPLLCAENEGWAAPAGNAMLTEGPPDPPVGGSATSTHASVEFALPSFDQMSGIEVNIQYGGFTSGDIDNYLLARIVVAGSTSDYIQSDALIEDGSTNNHINLGSNTNLWGLTAADFTGATNLTVQVYVVAEATGADPYYLLAPGFDYIGANIHTSTATCTTNWFGLDTTGNFAITTNGTTRYPLNELDTLAESGGGSTGTISLAGAYLAVDSISGWGGYQTGSGSTTNNAIVVAGYSTPNATNNYNSGWAFYSAATNVLQDKYAYARIPIPPWASSWAETAIVFRIRTSSDSTATNYVDLMLDDGSTAYSTGITNLVSTTAGAWLDVPVMATNLPSAWTNDLDNIRPALSLRGDYFAWQSNYCQWVEVLCNFE